jgi:acetyl-CoA carboxylase biotin carboxyl carrier protein
MSKLPVDAEAIRVLAEGDSRIRVVRAPNIVQAAVAPPAAQPAAMAPQPQAGQPIDELDFTQHPGAVKSPMVGVAYLAPEPGANNFVSVGQTVAAGQTLLLIEAMKTFNQIKAPRAGIVTRVLINPGVPVEYGEVLMVID